MRRFVFLAATVFSLLFLAACENQGEKVIEISQEQMEKTKEALEEQAEKIENSLGWQREDYLNEVRAKLDELDNRIGELKSKAEELDAESRAGLDPQIQEFQSNGEAFRNKLEESEFLKADAWEQFKTEVDFTMEDLESYYDQIERQTTSLIAEQQTAEDNSEAESETPDEVAVEAEETVAEDDEAEDDRVENREAPEESEYVVKPGDTLTGIATRSLGSTRAWRTIAEMNEIENPNKIYAGKRLRIPPPAQTAEE